MATVAGAGGGEPPDSGKGDGRQPDRPPNKFLIRRKTVGSGPRKKKETIPQASDHEEAERSIRVDSTVTVTSSSAQRQAIESVGQNIRGPQGPYPPDLYIQRPASSSIAEVIHGREGIQRQESAGLPSLQRSASVVSQLNDEEIQIFEDLRRRGEAGLNISRANTIANQRNGAHANRLRVITEDVVQDSETHTLPSGATPSSSSQTPESFAFLSLQTPSRQRRTRYLQSPITSRDSSLSARREDLRTASTTYGSDGSSMSPLERLAWRAPENYERQTSSDDPVPWERYDGFIPADEGIDPADLASTLTWSPDGSGDSRHLASVTSNTGLIQQAARPGTVEPPRQYGESSRRVAPRTNLQQPPSDPPAPTALERECSRECKQRDCYCCTVQ